MRDIVIVTEEQYQDGGPYDENGDNMASRWVWSQVPLTKVSDRCTCGKTRQQHEEQWPACKSFRRPIDE